MLVIRKAQLDAFAEVARRRFEDEMVAHVGEKFPERCAELATGETALSLRETVRATITQALAYWMDDEIDIEAFVDLSFERGPGFEQEAGMEDVARLLQDQALPGEAKMALVIRRLDEDREGGDDAEEEEAR